MDLRNKNNRFYGCFHEEWGVPLHDDRKLFEFIVLDAFQAGLSFNTILNKRENFRKAFDDFQPGKIARYGDKRIEKLLNDERIIRNKLKIYATINNARRFVEIQKENGSFDKYIWQFTNGKTIKNHWKDIKEMQAAGMVNDHLVECHRYNSATGQDGTREK